MKILIVEDEPLLGLEIRDDLNDWGHQVCEILPDGDAVLPAVVRHRPDLIIMDIKIFGFRDGIEAAKRLRAAYAVPIIFLTSYSLEEIRSRLTGVDPFLYLPKPYDQAALRSALTALVPG